MGKKRVHEIAKDLDLNSKDIISALTGLGVEVKSHMSTVETGEIDKLYQTLGKAPGNRPTPAKTVGQQAAERPASPKPDAPKRSVRLSQYGPGLVDRVPQRPPDRRYVDRPMHIPVPIPRAGSEQEVPQETVPRAAEPGPAAGRPVASEPAPERTEPQPQAEPDRPTPTVTRPPQQPRPYGQGAPHPAQHRPHQGDRPAPGAAPGGRPPQYGNRPASGGPPGRPPQYGNRPAPGGPPGRPPQYGNRPAPGGPPGRLPQYGGRPAPGGAPGRPPQYGGRPAPGGRPTGGPILSKNIPKPPAQLEATKPDKGAGQQRFADRKEKGKGGDRRRPWEKKGAREQQTRTRHRRPAKHDTRYIPPSERKPIVVSGALTVKDLAEKAGIKAAEIIKKLMAMGTMATINQEVDADTAVLIAEDLGFNVEFKPEVTIEERLEFESEEDIDPENQETRPPVVTVMGHVDHGKTSLLDAIRDANVTATEAGGITQHIGAYQVRHNSKRITFLDTPGHEAFTAMRARGARVTDIAILVVAADDGVKPQTIEALNHAKAAGVPMVVAINKIDKPDANPDKVKQQLVEHGLVAEEWGGETIFVPVSAITREGLEDLLEMILLVAEVAELQANPKRAARGTIVESQLDKGRGPVATVLVQNGTLNNGDALVAGGVFARVRAMIDHKGRRVVKAGPSAPVEVLGFSEVPEAGVPFYVIEDEKMARQIAGKRQEQKRAEELKGPGRLSLEDVFKRIQEGEVKELPLIIKADVQGSVEALSQSLEKLSTEEVKVQLVHQGVGAITETDVMLASASNAIIIGFNVRPDVNARRATEQEHVDVRLYQVIYDATANVKAALSGLLDPEYREVVLGHAEVRQVFKASKIGTIAGCYVVDGKIARDANIRVVRDGKIVHTGKLDSLKRFKDDAKEVAQGYECGLTIERYNDVEEGDELEFYIIEEIERKL